MTYYEEFGISPTASADEIRNTYRHLCRMLHPDRYSDEVEKQLAELQMRRLNQVAITLMDKDRRGVYDERLQVERRAGGTSSRLGWRTWVHFALRRLIERRQYPWVVIGVSVLLAIGLVSHLSPGYSRNQTAAFPIPVAAPNSSVSARTPSATPHTAGGERRTARRSAAGKSRSGGEGEGEGVAILPLEEIPALTDGIPAQRRTVPAPVAPERENAARPVPVRSRNLATAENTEVPSEKSSGVPGDEASGSDGPAEAPSPLAGMWIYGGDSGAGAQVGMYPPEYIEMRVESADGELRGHYRGRYRVLDQAIGPEVAFSFRGKPTGDEARVVWEGTGGSRGEARLRLLTEETMEVEWHATRLNSPSSLVAGSAELTRRK